MLGDRGKAKAKSSFVSSSGRDDTVAKATSASDDLAL
jgi:hypothetical protein